MTSICNKHNYRIRITPVPPEAGLFPLGTRVASDMVGRETGLVIGYNANWASFYPPERYPYVILWQDGYFDYYNPSSFQVNA